MPTGKTDSILFGVMMLMILAGAVMVVLSPLPTAIGAIAGITLGLVFLLSGFFQLGQMEHGRPFFLGSIIGGLAFNESSRRPPSTDSEYNSNELLDPPITPADEPGGLFWRFPGLVQVKVIPMRPFSFEVEDPNGKESIPSLPTKDGDVKIEMTVQAVYTDSFAIFGFDESVRKTGLNNAILGSLRERLGRMSASGVRTLRGKEHANDENFPGADQAEEGPETFVQDIVKTVQDRIKIRGWPFRILSADLDNITLPENVEKALQKKRVETEEAVGEEIEIGNVINRMKQIKAGFPGISDEMIVEIVADERGKMQGRRSIRIPGLVEAARALGSALRKDKE